MEEIKPIALSRFTDDQATYLHEVLQADTQEPSPSTSMEITEPRKSHIHEMYKQSFHATEEDVGPMFMDDSDEE